MLWKPFSWLVPGGHIIGVLASIGSAILRFFGWLISTAVDGLTKMIANPTTFVVVLIVAPACYGLGIHRGIKWSAHKVNTAYAALDAARSENEGLRADNGKWIERLNEEKKDHANAIQASTKAVAEARAARARLSESERLRHAPGAGGAKAGPQKAPEAGLLGLPALSW